MIFIFFGRFSVGEIVLFFIKFGVRVRNTGVNCSTHYIVIIKLSKGKQCYRILKWVLMAEI